MRSPRPQSRAPWRRQTHPLHGPTRALPSPIVRLRVARYSGSAHKPRSRGPSAIARRRRRTAARELVAGQQAVTDRRWTSPPATRAHDRAATRVPRRRRGDLDVMDVSAGGARDPREADGVLHRLREARQRAHVREVHRHGARMRDEEPVAAVRDVTGHRAVACRAPRPTSPPSPASRSSASTTSRRWSAAAC